MLGAIADVKGRRKPWLAMFVVILCLAMSALWLAKPGLPTPNIIVILVAPGGLTGMLFNRRKPAAAPGQAETPVAAGGH